MIKITKTNWEKDELKHYFVIWSKSNPAQKTQESMESMQRLSVTDMVSMWISDKSIVLSHHH